MHEPDIDALPPPRDGGHCRAADMFAAHLPPSPRHEHHEPAPAVVRRSGPDAGHRDGPLLPVAGLVQEA